MRKEDYPFGGIGIFMILSEIWKQLSLTYIVYEGCYNWWYFPFQLCSIPMYVCLILPFMKSESIRLALYAFLMDFGMVGGIFAFFDTTGMHYSYFPLTVHSYLWHIALILLGIAAGVRWRKLTNDSSLRDSFRNYRGAVAFYLLCCIIATFLNLFAYSYGTINMFYISPHYPMTQRVFTHIAHLLGNNAGIAVYIGSTIFGAGIFHIFWSRR